MKTYRYEQKGKKVAYFTSLYDGFKKRNLFKDLETYCMFIGYPRSGHSLIGSLLDAHPNIVISHELDALGFLETGFGKNQICSLILQNDQNFTQNGREWTDYNYAVPNQYQGRFETIRVIGDKKGRVSTERLNRNPSLLKKLRLELQVNIKMVHVIRNPYDNISTIYKRSNITLSDAVERYFSLCEGVLNIKNMVNEVDIVDIKHEKFVETPQEETKKLVQFLGLGCTNEYVMECASVVKKTPHRSRHDINWTDELIQLVKLKSERIDFLQDYQFDD